MTVENKKAELGHKNVRNAVFAQDDISWFKHLSGLLKTHICRKCMGAISFGE